jgi:hypothetical protein
MRSIPVIGALTQDRQFPELWISQPVPVPFFLGTPLRFVIISDKWDSADQPGFANAVGNFLSLGESDRGAASSRVFKNYRDFFDIVEEVAVQIDDPAKVWNYVQPTEIFVQGGDDGDSAIYVQVACECGWEIEHGLQLVFRQGNELIRVSEQDGHLTDADS